MSNPFSKYCLVFIVSTLAVGCTEGLPVYEGTPRDPSSASGSNPDLDPNPELSSPPNGGYPEDTHTPTPQPTPAVTPEPPVVVVPTRPPSPSPTFRPRPTPSARPSAPPRPTPAPTVSPTPIPSPVVTPVATPSPSPTPFPETPTPIPTALPRTPIPAPETPVPAPETVHPISIISPPVLNAYVGLTYSYPVKVHNPGQYSLSYTVRKGPAPLRFASNGNLIWNNPTPAYLGTHEVVIEVADQENSLNYGLQTFLLSVEYCKKGKRLGVWLDTNDDGSIVGEPYVSSVISYTGRQKSKKNYGYRSHSAHPRIGPRPLGFKSHVFFYEGRDGLTLNFFHNVDRGGSKNNIVNWDIYTKGNFGSDRVIFSDDPKVKKKRRKQRRRKGIRQKGELYFANSWMDLNGKNHHYAGRWHYWKNTDGGVIGPFVGTDFSIRIRILTIGDIGHVRFYSAGGGGHDLHDPSGRATSFIIQSEDYENCSR